MQGSFLKRRKKFLTTFSLHIKYPLWLWLACSYNMIFIRYVVKIYLRSLTSLKYNFACTNYFIILIHCAKNCTSLQTKQFFCGDSAMLVNYCCHVKWQLIKNSKVGKQQFFRRKKGRKFSTYMSIHQFAFRGIKNNYLLQSLKILKNFSVNITANDWLHSKVTSFFSKYSNKLEIFNWPIKRSS